jgi:hypothetical protein
MKFLKKKLFAIIPGITLISVLPTVITSCKTEELHIPADTTFEIKNNRDLSNFFNSSLDESSNDYSHVYIYPGNYDYHPSVFFFTTYDTIAKVAAVFSSFTSNPADTFVGEPNKTIINIDVDVQKATSLFMFPFTYETG